MIARLLFLASQAGWGVAVGVLAQRGAWVQVAVLAALEVATWGFLLWRFGWARGLIWRLELARFTRTGRAPAWRRRAAPAEPKLRDRDGQP